MTMSDTLESKILRHMTTTVGMAAIVDAELAAELFEEPVNRAAFAYGLDYYRDYKKAPSPEVLTTQFPVLTLTDTPDETVPWLVEQLQRRHLINLGQDMMRCAATSLVDDPFAALHSLATKAHSAFDHLGKIKTHHAGPKLWNASDLAPGAQPRWLAKNHIPRGAVSLLVGDEGIGKSLFWVYVAAAVTTGKPVQELGIPQRDPANVIVVVTEDDWSTTVRPRLEVAGADLDRVQVICTEADGSGAPEFPRDMHLLECADTTPALIVVDAWLDTVPSRLSVRDAQQARQALHPWKEVATTTGAAILLLTHTNRVASGNTRDKYGATSELRKKARMTLFAQRDEDGSLLIGPDKANTTRTVVASRFGIVGVGHFRPTDDHDGTVPLLSYAGESDSTAQEHVTETFHATGKRSGANQEAELWLSLALADGPRWAADLNEAGESAGYSKDRLKRARKTLTVGSKKASTSGGGWFWYLPKDQGAEPDCEGSRTNGQREHL